MRLELKDLRRDRAWRPPAAWLAALDRLSAPVGAADWTAALVLVDPERIAELNRRWRGRDEVTDVLSFSYLEDAGEGGPTLAAGTGHAARDFWLPAWEAGEGAAVGEIVLAPAFIAAECAREGRSEDRELALLTVHGLLHVLGWEHGGTASGRAMRERETKLLRAGGFTHPLAEGGRTD